MKIKFHKNPTSGSRAIPCRRTNGQADRHDDAESRVSQFCERAKKYKTNWKVFVIVPQIPVKAA